MALLNLILLPLLAVLSLFETAPGSAGNADAAGDAGGAPPATGDASADDSTDDSDEPLGDAGKRALDSERDARRRAERRAKAAEEEAERLKTANQSEQERAVTEAKKAGKTEADQVWHGRFLRAEAKSALAAAGVGDVSVAVAAFLDEHRDLKVTDEGDIEDLDATVQKFKKAHPTLFTARVPGGSADQGAKPPDQKPRSLEDAISAQLTSAGRPS